METFSHVAYNEKTALFIPRDVLLLPVVEYYGSADFTRLILTTVLRIDLHMVTIKH